MMPSSSRSELPIQPWVLLAVGFLVGQTSQGSSAVETFYSFVDRTLVPLYAFLVLVYLGSLLVQKRRPKTSTAAARRRSIAESDIVPVGEKLAREGEQPIDMSGAYKLVQIENFEAFLEVQGVPWALRRAASKARPTHRITHQGNRITIKIEGIIESQTTYIINGPPVEINIRGRIFQDRVSYLESGDGIQVLKKAVTENYDIIVQRRLSEDKQKITMTSRAEFKDGNEPVTCTQIFNRIE